MKRLIIRLSSLGDLILAQAALQPPYAGETHWLVASEYSSLLQGSPKVSRVWSFDRKANGGLRAWFNLLALLRAQGFDEVLDLHSTLRTRIARFYFRILSSRTSWRSISKERIRRWGYITLKRNWPSSLRPRHFARKCALIAGGSGQEKPDLRWLLSQAKPSPGESFRNGTTKIGLAPASAWPGKEWATAYYLEAIKQHQRNRPGDSWVLFGTASDSAAIRLRAALRESGIPFHDTVGKATLKDLAKELVACAMLVGADTGLLHFAEALGIPVVTIYGPTRSDFGFGPLLEKSRPIEVPIWCSPCSKDGTLCFRPVERYRCLKDVEPKALVEQLGGLLKTSSSVSSESRGGQ